MLFVRLDLALLMGLYTCLKNRVLSCKDGGFRRLLVGCLLTVGIRR